MDTLENTPRSPLENLSIGRFNGRTYATERVVSVGTSRVVLIKNNPNRVYWQIINEGNNHVRVSIDAAITDLTGWLLPAAGGVIFSSWEEDGESVGYDLYAISVLNSNNIRIRETIRL